jgi:hypothetical protein
MTQRLAARRPDAQTTKDIKKQRSLAYRLPDESVTMLHELISVAR